MHCRWSEKQNIKEFSTQLQYEYMHNYTDKIILPSTGVTWNSDTSFVVSVRISRFLQKTTTIIYLYHFVTIYDLLTLTNFKINIIKRIKCTGVSRYKEVCKWYVRLASTAAMCHFSNNVPFTDCAMELPYASVDTADVRWFQLYFFTSP